MNYFWLFVSPGSKGIGSKPTCVFVSWTQPLAEQDSRAANFDPLVVACLGSGAFSPQAKVWSQIWVGNQLTKNSLWSTIGRRIFNQLSVAKSYDPIPRKTLGCFCLSFTILRRVRSKNSAPFFLVWNIHGIWPFLRLLNDWSFFQYEQQLQLIGSPPVPVSRHENDVRVHFWDLEWNAVFSDSEITSLLLSNDRNLLPYAKLARCVRSFYFLLLLCLNLD